MDYERQYHFRHMIDTYKESAINTRDIATIREGVAFCQGIILVLIATDCAPDLELYAQHAQGELFTLWTEINKE